MGARGEEVRCCPARSTHCNTLQHTDFICSISHPYVTWRIHVWLAAFICDMTYISLTSCFSRHTHKLQESVSWLIHRCDMTHSLVWHNSFTCATRLIAMCDVSHWHVAPEDTQNSVSLLIHKFHMTYWHDRNDAQTCASYIIRTFHLQTRGSCENSQPWSLHMGHLHINVSYRRLVYMWMTAHDSQMNAFIIFTCQSQKAIAWHTRRRV